MIRVMITFIRIFQSIAAINQELPQQPAAGCISQNINVCHLSHPIYGIILLEQMPLQEHIPDFIPFTVILNSASLKGEQDRRPLGLINGLLPLALKRTLHPGPDQNTGCHGRNSMLVGHVHNDLRIHGPDSF